jgi:hypothetical protein
VSALTYEIKDVASPVSRWLRGTFPQHKEIQAAYRVAAGVARVVPSPAVAPGTQGAAIDWWLRIIIDPAVPVDLVYAGLRTGWASCIRAGLELLAALGGLDEAGAPQPVQPALLASLSFRDKLILSLFSLVTGSAGRVGCITHPTGQRVGA